MDQLQILVVGLSDEDFYSRSIMGVALIFTAYRASRGKNRGKAAAFPQLSPA
jgi:hypothetical protein